MPADDPASEREDTASSALTGHFKVGEHRYSRLEDAIAQARRRGPVAGDGS